MTAKPKRRYEVTITAGADDLESLIHIIEYALRDLKPDTPYSAISGGYSGNHSIELCVYPEVTHETFAAALEAYLADSKRHDD